MIGLTMREGRPLATFAAAALLASCSATKETSSTWAESPGGDWQTLIARNDTAGPGNNYLSETVQLRRGTQAKPVDVLTLAENAGSATLKLAWHDPTHLVIGYSNAEVLFQAVKLGELTIETRELDK